jgi:hypothetical protein
MVFILYKVPENLKIETLFEELLYPRTMFLDFSINPAYSGKYLEYSLYPKPFDNFINGDLLYVFFCLQIVVKIIQKPQA